MSARGRDQRPGSRGRRPTRPPKNNTKNTSTQLMQGDPKEPGQNGSKQLSEDMERRLAIELVFSKPLIERLAEAMGRKANIDIAKGCTDRRKKTCVYFSQIPPPIIGGDRSVASHKVPDALRNANTYMSMISRMTNAGVIPSEVMTLAIDKQNVEPCLNILLPVMSPIMAKLDEIVKQPENAKIEMTPMIISPVQRQLLRGKQCDAILKEWADFANEQWSQEKQRVIDELNAVPQGTDIVEYTRKTAEEIESTRKKLWYEHGEQQRISAEKRRQQLAASEEMYGRQRVPPILPPPPHYNNYFPDPPMPQAPYAAPSVSRMSGPSFDSMGPGLNPPPPPRPLMAYGSSYSSFFGSSGPALESWRPGGNSGTFPSRKRPLLGADPSYNDGRSWSSPSFNGPQYGREPPHFQDPAQEERNKAGERTHHRIQMLVDLIKDRFPDPNSSIYGNAQLQKAIQIKYSTLEQAEDVLVSIQDLWTLISRGAPTTNQEEPRNTLANPSHSKIPSIIRVNGMSFRRVTSDLMHLITPGANAIYRSEDGSQMNTVKVVCIKNEKVVIDYEDNISVVSSSDLYISGVA